MRGGRLGEREGPVDDRLDAAGFEQRPDLARAARRRSRPSPRPVRGRSVEPGDRQPPPEHAAQIDAGAFAAHQADLHEAPVNGERGKIALQIVAADDVEDHIDAAAAGHARLTTSTKSSVR